MRLVPNFLHSNSPHQILRAAQLKLQAMDDPLLFRIISFLRLSCLVMEKKGVYAKLLRSLSEQDSQWWTTCKVTSSGTLTTSNLAIKKLLVPVLKLHRTYYFPSSNSKFKKCKTSQWQGRSLHLMACSQSNAAND